MENRFLFRGKRIDTGEWVEGMPFEIEGKTMMLIRDDENLLRTHYLDENMWNAEIYCVEVDPSTICRCTGFKDKNGKLIWENDITKNDKGNLYRAFWQDDHYQFSWVCVKSEKLPIGAKWNFECFRGYEMEIIGNAFDNPELLE